MDRLVRVADRARRHRWDRSVEEELHADCGRSTGRLHPARREIGMITVDTRERPGLLAIVQSRRRAEGKMAPKKSANAINCFCDIMRVRKA